jgi:hypothetical protein
LSLPFPTLQSHVTRPVKPEHLLPYSPKSSWDGWFAIGLFSAQSKIRWAKAHLFHRACRPGFHPLASFEGMDQSSEICFLVADKDNLSIMRHELDTRALSGRLEPFKVALPDRFLFCREDGKYLMNFQLPEHSASMKFQFAAEWPIWWSNGGRLLHYIGQHSSLDVEIERGGSTSKLSGMGVVEHVCGISLPIDVTRICPVHWHWDVLLFEGDESPKSSAAGLSIGFGGKTRIQLRAALRLPGSAPRAVRGLDVRYHSMESGEAEGRRFAVPKKWQGTLCAAGGTFRYEAVRSTPVAAVVLGGGMTGFDFEAEWTPRAGKTEIHRGTGFCEYGDFGGHLPKLIC